MKYLVIVILLISCTKSVENSSVAKSTNNVLNSSYLIQDLDSTRLSISLEPNVVCYSYKNGEIPKPCDIFVYATINLSKPIKAGLQIELQREDLNSNSTVIMVIAPNTTQTILNTGFQNQNNEDVPDVVRIRKITLVPMHD